MSALESVRTMDGAVWERRAETRGGLALYAVQGAPKCCPPFVMATLEELAEHGIQSAELAAAVELMGALPMPAGPEPQVEVMSPKIAAELNNLRTRLAGMANPPRELFLALYDGAEPELFTTVEAARECCDDLAKTDAHGNCWDWAVNEYGIHIQFWTHPDDDRPLSETPGSVTPIVVQGSDDLSELERLRAQVAELLAERHATNESLSEAAEALRANRDQITELERPAVERHRREVRESYRWLAAHAREDGDFEGEAVVVQQLAEREQLWRREDKLAREFAADPLAAKPWEPGPSAQASADKLTALFAPTQALREDEAAEVFVPRTERSYWEDIATALNAAVTVGMPIGIDLDGTLTDHNAWSVVWDRGAERWAVAGYEDGCPRNVIDGDQGGHFFKKGAFADSAVACTYCGAKRPESGGAK